jgi:hypothetical protein
MDFVHSRFGTRDAAEYAVSTLLEAGFPRAMISLSADEPRRRSGPGAGASPHDASQRASYTRATGMFGGVVGALMGASLAPFALSVSTGTMTESAVLAIATGRVRDGRVRLQGGALCESSRARRRGAGRCEHGRTSPECGDGACALRTRRSRLTDPRALRRRIHRRRLKNRPCVTNCYAGDDLPRRLWYHDASTDGITRDSTMARWLKRGFVETRIPGDSHAELRTRGRRRCRPMRVVRERDLAPRLRRDDHHFTE